MKRASRTGANMRAVSAMELAEMRRHSARVRACAEALALPNRRAENPVRYGVLFLTPQEPGRAGFSNSFQHGGAPKFSAILPSPLSSRSRSLSWPPEVPWSECMDLPMHGFACPLVRPSSDPAHRSLRLRV